jgi:hypothetical protein
VNRVTSSQDRYPAINRSTNVCDTSESYREQATGATPRGSEYKTRRNPAAHSHVNNNQVRKKFIIHVSTFLRFTRGVHSVRHARDRIIGPLALAINPPIGSTGHFAGHSLQSLEDRCGGGPRHFELSDAFSSMSSMLHVGGTLRNPGFSLLPFSTSAAGGKRQRSGKAVWRPSAFCLVRCC